MKIKIEDNIEELNHEEYLAYKKGKLYDSIASSISWIAFCFMLVCCRYCHIHPG